MSFFQRFFGTKASRDSAYSQDILNFCAFLCLDILIKYILIKRRAYARLGEIQSRVAQTNEDRKENKPLEVTRRLKKSHFIPVQQLCRSYKMRIQQPFFQQHVASIVSISTQHLLPHFRLNVRQDDRLLSTSMHSRVCP